MEQARAAVSHGWRESLLSDLDGAAGRAGRRTGAPPTPVVAIVGTHPSKLERQAAAYRMVGWLLRRNRLATTWAIRSRLLRVQHGEGAAPLLRLAVIMTCSDLSQQVLNALHRVLANQATRQGASRSIATALLHKATLPNPPIEFTLDESFLGASSQPDERKSWIASLWANLPPNPHSHPSTSYNTSDRCSSR